MFPSTIHGGKLLPVRNKTLPAGMQNPVSTSNPLSLASRSADLSLESFPELPVNLDFENPKSPKSLPASKLVISFQPTPGLVSLFTKTGTAWCKGRVTSTSLSPSPFHSYAVVARSAMERNHR